MVDIQSILESMEQRSKLLSETGKANKALLFEALSAAEIDLVSVTFDGEGDSGQIENVIARKGETQVPIPEQSITLQSASWDGKEVTLQAQTLREAIEQVCYDYLSQEHDGWENNDGAFGEFTLEIAGKKVELEFNGRFSDTYTNTYTF